MPGPPAGPSLRITTTSPVSILPCRDRRHRVLLGLEHARRARVCGEALVARELHHAALGREVAAQDREAAGGLERVSRAGARPAGPRSPVASRACSPIVRPVTVGASVVQQPGLEQALGHQRHAARPVQVDGDVLRRRA